MKTILQSFKSKTVLKALALGIGSIAVAVLTELDLIAYIGVANMIVDVALRFLTTEPVSAK